MKKIRVFLTMIFAVFIATPVFAAPVGGQLSFSKDLGFDPTEDAGNLVCSPGNTEFDVDFKYDTVYGVARCVDKFSSDQVLSQLVDNGSMVPGPNCWCYLQGLKAYDIYGLSSNGILLNEFKSDSECSEYCGCACAEALAYNGDIRSALYSQPFYNNGGSANVTYSCGTGASGTPPVDSNSYPVGEGVLVPTVSGYCTPPSGKKHLNKWECVDAGGVVTTTVSDNTVSDNNAFIITSNTVCTAQYRDHYHVTYACGGNGGTAPTDSNGYEDGDTVTTKANTCNTSSGSMFAYWVCGGTPVGAGKTFTITGDTTCTAYYLAPSFTATTSSISNNGTLNFNLSAGGNYRVDCGRGGILSGGTINDAGVVSRGNTTDTMYTCTYNTAGTKKVSFYKSGGTSSYNTSVAALSFYSGSTNANKATNAAKITAISGSLSTLFPTTSGNNPIFLDSFRGTSITTVPPTVFGSYATTGPNGMFKRTFRDCTSLTTIQSGAFDGITTGSARMFESTFQGCTALTTVPDNLFANITGHSNYLFNNTFNGCSSLSGSISPRLFAGLISAGSQSGTDMMTGAFASTNLAISCTGGTTQFITGYESSWDSHVSCIDAPFKLTTTSLSANDTFDFRLTAIGNFNVNCGIGGTLSGTGVSGTTIARADTTPTVYTCTYATSGAKTIYFGGTATDYHQSASAISFHTSTAGNASANDANAVRIASLSGNLSTIFPYISGNTATGHQPRFLNTFRNTTNLTSIPSTLFSNYTNVASDMFSGTFNISGLTSIPEDLFANITTSANSAFSGVFRSCTGLTSIPNGLFSGITTGATNMFTSAFAECTGLTSLPPDLFGKITTGGNGMFNSAFKDCTNLSGYISPTFFAGLIRNNVSTSMMSMTFDNTGLATSCASYPGMVQYTTPYDSSWVNKVSCIPAATISTSWYSNNNLISVNASEQSCTFGDVLSLPTAPERTGYTFNGWTVRSNNASCCPNLTSASNGTCYAQKYSSGTGTNGSGCNDFLSLLSVGQYVVKFANGTVWGDTLCSTTSGTNATVGLPESTAGANCWCKITSCSGDDINNCPTKSLWVFHSTRNSNNNCLGLGATGCTQFCADAVMSNSTFRSAAFTAAGL